MGLSSEYEPIFLASAFQGVVAWLRRHATLFRFALIGATGYVIYQVVFFLLYDSSLVWFLPDKGESVRLVAFSHSDSRLLISTLVAAEFSIVGVFIGNHLWTFRDRVARGKPIWLRFCQFNAKAAVSSLGIITLVVNLLTLGLDVTPYMAIPVGVAAAFTWNWLWDSRFIWPSTVRRDGAT